MDFLKISPSENNAIFNKDQIASFLVKQLGEYGDPKEHILKCLDYATDPERGGLIILAVQNEEIIGAAVLNHTGMKDYIPENILVYIAVHSEQRGNGLGRKLMETVIENTNGGIALHVEPENPAKKLYEKLGFTNKYLEMRMVR